MKKFFLFAVGIILLLMLAFSRQSNLPEGFVYLRSVDPSIIQEIRYFSEHNFIGRPMQGYSAGECILTNKAAEALRKIQKELAEYSYTLKVYDCYRPAQASEYMYQWAQGDPMDNETQAEFYPIYNKSQLFDMGLIARHSGHNRGSTVDLTVVELPAKKQPEYHKGQPLFPCFANLTTRFADNTIDMATGFDCFHETSYTENPNLTDYIKSHRYLLKNIMAKYNFTNFYMEWWHYTLANEPFPTTYFNFTIETYNFSQKFSIIPLAVLALLILIL